MIKMMYKSIDIIVKVYLLTGTPVQGQKNLSRIYRRYLLDPTIN